MMATYRVEIDGIVDQELAERLVTRLNVTALLEAGLSIRIVEHHYDASAEAGDE